MQVPSFMGQILDPCSVAASTTGIGGGYTNLQFDRTDTNTWTTIATPLSLGGMAGQPVDLRFRLNPHNTTNAGLGWMVDDIRVNGCNAPPASPGTGGASVIYADSVETYCVGLTVLLDGTGSYCGDGTTPAGYHWQLGGGEVATGPSYTVPRALAPGSYGYVLRVDCPGGTTIDSPVETITVLGTPGPVGDTLMAGVNFSAGTVWFTWTDIPGALGYYLVGSASPEGPWQFAGSGTDGATGVTFPLHTTPETLFFKVVGVNDCGAGPTD
jgi:hypothetical protein